MNTEETLQAYTQMAPHYEEYSKGRSSYLQAIEELVIAKIPAEARLLDIGAGDGRRLKTICEKASVKEIIAVEPSEGMATLCRERIYGQVLQITGEQLENEEIGTFDVITALWNVFGHIPGSGARLKTLQNIKSKLKPNGTLMLDVNNRHNAAAYGYWNVLGRRLLDAVAFNEKRGDTSYEWKVGETTVKGSGHLFTPAEIEKLVRDAGLKIISACSVDYVSGEQFDSKFKGQLFYTIGQG